MTRKISNTGYEALLSELDRRADIRRGDSIAPLLVKAAFAIRELLRAMNESVRSTPQHRKFFAILRAAHHHWPEDHVFQPLTPDGLRDYLQVKAGWGKVHKIIIDDNVTYWVEHKSIAYDKMSQDEFSKLYEAVCRIIEEQIGTDCETLLNSYETNA